MIVCRIRTKTNYTVR